MRLSRSFLIAAALLALLHVYIGSRLLPDLPIGVAGRTLGVLALALSCVLMPLGMMTRGMRDSPWADRLAWASLTTMGLFSSLLVFTMLRDVALLVAIFAAPSHTLAAIERLSAIAVVALAFLATCIGLINARRRARVVEVEIPVADLPADLHGFSIAQISDVHVGPTIKRNYVDAIVEAVNRLDVDVIAVTGDMVDGSVRQLAADVEPLGRLRARHGT
ncbi:MAG: metallophosphoesterase, partial [Steroidobacteraceae bacterium]